MDTKKDLVEPKIQMDAQPNSVSQIKEKSKPTVESTAPSTDDAMKQAEKIVQEMLRASRESMGDDPFADDNNMEEDDENDVDDLAKKHYESQLTQIREEQSRAETAKEEEIAELKRLLETTLNAQEKAGSVHSNEMEIQKEDGKTIPIIQTVDLNGTRTKVLICSFTREGGRIGLQIKRFRSQFFIMGVLEGMQAAKYANIGPGLLIYQIVSSAPGRDTGKNICVESAGALANAVNPEFQKGRVVTMKFLIPPANIPVHMIHQEVIKLPVQRTVRVIRNGAVW